MSYIHHDRNNEQMLVPITVIRGGTSRGFYFEGKNVPKPGEGLEQFVLAVRGSPDAMGMDGLGGDTPLQSKVAIVSPSSRPDADVDYTFIQMFPNAPTALTYRMNCGNISAGVPVFALMKNMVPDVKDGPNTIRVYSTNTKKMMYMTVDVLNGEAKVDGDCVMDGVPGTGSKILVDFRDQGGALTGKLFPSGNLVDTIKMDDGTTIDVTITDMTNPCVFFKAADFGIGLTGARTPQSRLVVERTARRAEASGRVALEGLSSDGLDEDDRRGKHQLHDAVRRLDRTPGRLHLDDRIEGQGRRRRPRGAMVRWASAPSGCTLRPPGVARPVCLLPWPYRDQSQIKCLATGRSSLVRAETSRLATRAGR